MAHDIFISHSAKDQPIPDAICEKLEAAGIYCWISSRDIHSGEEWPTAIAKGIATSRAMVLLFTANANASVEVTRELFVASTCKLIKIGLRMEKVDIRQDNIFHLADVHWIDVDKPPTPEQMKALVDLLVSLGIVPQMPIKPPERNWLLRTLSSVWTAAPTRAIAHFVQLFVLTLIRVATVTAAAILVLGIVLALVGSFVMARYAEATLREYSWDFSQFDPSTPYKLSPELFTEQATPYVEQHTFRTISETSLSFTSPNLVQLSGKIVGMPVVLDGIIYESDGSPQIELQHLNTLPLPVISGIISDGINRGMHDAWSNAPVRIKHLSMVGDSLSIETVSK